MLIGCASVPHNDETRAISARTPANASGSSLLPFGTSLPSALYQGPIEINLEGATRKAAKSYLPRQYLADKKWPLLIMLHGFSGTADSEDTYLGLRFRVSLRGFILLEPEGTKMPAGTLGPNGVNVGSNQFWNATDACCDFAKTSVDDVAYILGLIKKMKSTYRIDSSRIYIIGHSNGGFLANRLACESGKSFAAVASLAGGTFKNPTDCREPTPINYLHIQSIDDKTILYGPGPNYAGGQETVAQWLRKDGCSTADFSEVKRDFVLLIPGIDTTEQSWRGCSSGKDVSLWTIRAFDRKGDNPHVPLFNLGFMDAVLDYLFEHHN